MKSFIFLAASLGLSQLACAVFSHQVPPGPVPIAPTWRPAAVLRERVPGVGAEVVLNDRDGLSPDEAALMAVDLNPKLRALRANRGIGEAELIAARVLPNPRLDGTLDFPVSGADAVVLGYGIGLSWNVTPLFALGARRSAAEANLASVDLEVAWQEWQVAQAARLHVVRSIYLERRLRLALELEQTWKKRLDGLRQARAANAVTELEVSGGDRSYADARVGKLELERQLVAERAELNRALGADALVDVVLDLSFNPAAIAPRREGFLEELPQRRLDLIALRHAHRSHDEALRAAVIAQFPAVEVGFHAAREVDRNGSAGFGLTFELPFFDRNQSAVARERARRVQVEAEYDGRLLEARSEVVRIFKELGLVQEQVLAIREAAEAATRLAEMTRIAALAGAVSALVAADLLERSFASRLRVLEIEQTLAELQIALAVASGMDVR